MSTPTFAGVFLAEASQIIAKLDRASIERAATLIANTRAAGGRLFVLGIGGSAANASHAVNDFRKIAGIEAYAPTDNVSELTARANDDGWSSIFDSWLRTSRLCSTDLLLVLSVGGGNVEQNVSPNLVVALKYAKSVGAKILGILGRDGGYTATVADVCVLIPIVNPAHITPHTEAFQAIVWHLLVSHPAVKLQATKWESMARPEKRRAVFLDRDGVINRAVVRERKPYPPETADKLDLLPGVAGALQNLRQAGYLLIVVTNQPDVGRGTQSREILDAMHRSLSERLSLDDIFVCCHTDEDRCSCRKPLPGMLLEAAAKYNVDLPASFMVGDRWRDIEAGYNAGCRTILIDYGYSEKSPDYPPDVCVDSLREAAEWILSVASKGARSI
jgi:D-sedoheptulose 7-phosphate isomerase